MRVIQINERRCPCCGRGEVSGFIYPSCAEVDMPDAHQILCNGRWTPNLCAKCQEEES
jgi:hypothetical protein